MWLKQAEPSKFDIIFADLCRLWGISEFQLQARFHQGDNSRVLLVDNGCLVANFHDVPPFHSPSLVSMFPTIFSVCRVDGGTIFICV